MSSDGLEGVADVGPYGAQWQVRRHPVPACSTVLGLLPQRLACARTGGGGSHAVNCGRDGVPGLAPSPNPARSQESNSRVQPAPLRGLGALAVPEQAARCHETGTVRTAQCSLQWRGWAPSWEAGAAVPGREPQANDGAAP
jgi:hypothetical protein